MLDRCSLALLLDQQGDGLDLSPDWSSGLQCERAARTFRDAGEEVSFSQGELDQNLAGCIGRYDGADRALENIEDAAMNRLFQCQADVAGMNAAA